MKTKFLLILTAFSLFAFDAFSQATTLDALRYSLNRNYPTARVAALGGAYSAVGGDLGVASINPAGIGVFRNGAFSFSPSIGLNHTNSEFLDGTTLDTRPSFSLENGGVVFVNDMRKKYRTEKPSTWQNLNFSITYNRLASFKERSSAVGEYANHSLLDYFAVQAKGYSEGDLFFDPNDNNSLPIASAAFDAALAYNAFLINPTEDTTDTNYFNPYHGLKRQSHSSRTSGGIGEYGFNLAGNFADKLFIGGGVGIQAINYQNVTTWSEDDVLDTIWDFKSFSYTEDLSTKGVGVNLKFGLIAQITDWWRLAASVQSPTYSRVYEKYETSISSDFDNGDDYYFNSPYTSEFDYRQESPLKITAGTAFFFGSKGFISLDYDYQDLSQIIHRTDQDAFDLWAIDLNHDVAETYGQVHTVRAGAEIKSGPVAYRLGYANSTSPFVKPELTFDGDQGMQTFSGGLGFRQGSFFFDIAAIHSRSKEYILPYSLVGGEQNGILKVRNNTNLVFTLGKRI